LTKSIMSGQRIPLVNRISSGWSILRAWRDGTFGNAETALAFHNELCDVIRTHLHTGVEQARILELGCGQIATQTVLFQADGADVVGIDVEVPTYTMGLGTLIKVIRTNGVERALKSLLRHWLFDRRSFAELSAKYGKRLPFEALDVRLMDATHLSFPDDYFDFVYSAWVFEHVADVAGAVREMNRVLKPSGIAWINAHLFPSLSGGHNLEWLHPDEKSAEKVPPWDHLLDNRFPVNTYLNKLRLDDYRRIFADTVDVIDEALACEGIDLLTPTIEESLHNRGYTREELLTYNLRFLCRKKDTHRRQAVGHTTQNGSTT